ncbi:type II secretion system protein [Vibrio cortegadensis]|uniref:Type II secretion system protein n=1 Tax=Vibrio cortegadensis TaxID=1328770 RepID=A0ABV4M5Q4_9VIBR
MKKQGGFTLIELVVVIVILGILAVTAAPRFLNLQDDARDSTIEGLKGAMSGAGAITYGKAAIAGQDGPTGAISIGSSTLSLVHGYPAATSSALSLVVDGLNEWDLKTGSTGNVVYGVENYKGSCVRYTQAASKDTAATVVVVVPGKGTPVEPTTACD